MNSINIKKNIWNQRIIPAIIIVVFLICSVVLLRFSFYWSFELLKTNISLFWIARSLSIIFILLFSFWIFFEISKAYLKNKFFSVLQSLFLLSLFFVNQRFLFSVLLIQENGINNHKTNIFWRDWEFFLTLFLNSIICMLFRVYIIKNINWLQLLLKTFTFFISLLILSTFIKAFVYLNTIDSGIEYIVLFILIASSSDIGGYFGGMFFGNKFFTKKMAPMISPNKTWEGAFVGYLSSLIVSLLFIYVYYGIGQNYSITHDIGSIINNFTGHSFGLILLLSIAPLLSITGDLYFSFIKRKLEIKDYSNILRGHGGIIDRVDSISFVFFAWTFISLII
ncbi:phosphatidate cytidylyltransferase [Mycoplasmopsis felis]|uniref:Phosphatidate cytidylyltransferase n=1 Tax=Mycoplasmopsis felis TaxID=33923 RepID=A0A809SE61_9BACT|nr:phosphatidate cytidylyltransferase [Mycoplasmopsis felis]BBU47619.1 phosphatidate cytidylyltransferase [Mycoplasmopsis felis]